MVFYRELVEVRKDGDQFYFVGRRDGLREKGYVGTGFRHPLFFDPSQRPLYFSQAPLVEDLGQRVPIFYRSKTIGVYFAEDRGTDFLQANAMYVDVGERLDRLKQRDRSVDGRVMLMGHLIKISGFENMVLPYEPSRMRNSFWNLSD
jgi:hypothetical protein